MTSQHMHTTALVMAFAVAAGGCGTTSITTTEPTARIFADGQMLGRGHAELSQRGTPGSTRITVTTDDGRRADQVVKRRFTGFTFLTGFFTYGICFFACWEYPSDVIVPLAPARRFERGSGDAFAADQDDPWLRPPPGWQPRTAPPAATPAAP